MTYIEALLIAIALAMDCFTISFSCGLLQRKMGKQVWAMAVLFGSFQSLMTLLGWLATGAISPQYHLYDKWLSFVLLAGLGLKMIWEGCHPQEHKCINPSQWKILFLLAVATSVDALAVGCSFVGMNICHRSEIAWSIVLIGLVSFLFTLCGKYIGVKVGNRFPWRGEKIGGIILIALGLKVILQL